MLSLSLNDTTTSDTDMWLLATLKYIDDRSVFLVNSLDPEASLEAWETYVFGLVGDAVEMRLAGQDESFEELKAEYNVDVTKAQISVSSKFSRWTMTPVWQPQNYYRNYNYHISIIARIILEKQKCRQGSPNAIVP